MTFYNKMREQFYSFFSKHGTLVCFVRSSSLDNSMLYLLANFEGLNPCQSFGISAKLSEGTREQGTEGTREQRTGNKREQKVNRKEQREQDCG